MPRRAALLLPLALAGGCSHDAPGGHVAAGALAPASAAVAAPPAATASAPAPEVAAPRGRRLHARARFVWVHPEPRLTQDWIGTLGLSGSIAVDEPVLHARARSGCRAWYRVAPRGYVCEGDAATTDEADPTVAHVAAGAPKIDSPWPYEYGESTGAERYPGPPTPAEVRAREWDMNRHFGLLARARAGDVDARLAGVDLSPAQPTRWGPIPARDELMVVSPLVREERSWIAPGSTIAWTREIDVDGRAYLLTHDLALVPKDRVRPFPRSTFHGVELGGEVRLPLAFFRESDRPRYRRAEDGAFVRTAEVWPRLSWVALTGAEERDEHHTFLATREPGIWARADEAQVVRRAEPPAEIARRKSGRRTWIDVSVLGGTLVAYEGEAPVYATLISPGRGGVPVEGTIATATAATPTGIFHVEGKLVTSTMVSSTNPRLIHTEVQHVQSFHGPHSLHAATWHDRWGERKSGGCVNLAPLDAKRLFDWTEPPLPEGWYGLRATPGMGPRTVVVVRE